VARPGGGNTAGQEGRDACGQRTEGRPEGKPDLNGTIQTLLKLSRGIDAVNYRFGIIANYLVLFSALLSAANAAFRYGINGLIALSRDFHFLSGIQALVRWYGNNSNAFLEGQWYMFAGMVLFGAAWTLKVNEHVRVDLVYGMVSDRARVYIDLIGGLFFLMPMCVVLMYFTWPWFVGAFNSGEVSTNAGGLIRWPVLLVLPVGFGLVALQGVSEIIKCIAALTIGYRREHAYEKPLQ
jgi:TRAP-type mannitol/chloroaromatic compound transport system permease small subunit